MNPNYTNSRRTLMFERRIQHLEESHKILDDQIAKLEKSGKYSDEHIQTLKKKKLHLKDEIAKLKRQQWEHDQETLDFDDDR